METNAIQRIGNTDVVESSMLAPEIRETMLAPVLQFAVEEFRSITVSFRQPVSQQTALQAPARSLEETEEMVRSIPPVRICLNDGCITVNNRRMSIPIGLRTVMTGREFKQFAGIYAGDSLFIHMQGGMQRISDYETIDVMPDEQFTHQAPAPKVRSFSNYQTD